MINEEELRKRVIKLIVATNIKNNNINFIFSPELSYAILEGRKFDNSIINAIKKSLKKFLNNKYEKIILPENEKEYIEFILRRIKNELYNK
jgi:hypothetical protein